MQAHFGQFLATENLLKMMKNSFYFTLKAIFGLKVFQRWSLLFGLDLKDKFNLKIYDVTA